MDPPKCPPPLREFLIALSLLSADYVFYFTITYLLTYLIGKKSLLNIKNRG